MLRMMGKVINHTGRIFEDSCVNKYGRVSFRRFDDFFDGLIGTAFIFIAFDLTNRSPMKRKLYEGTVQLQVCSHEYRAQLRNVF